MKTLLFFISIILLNVSISHSQIISKEISAGNYKIILEWNDSVFFSGKMTVQDPKDNSSLFSADGFHSGYNWDSLTDLDNDGIDEYILELETGSSRSDYNMYLIFDFSKGSKPLYEIHNAEIIENVDKTPVIVSNMRIGAPALEARYSYVIKYSKGNLSTLSDTKESKALKELIPFEEDYSDLVSQYAKNNDVCGSSSEVKYFYSAYILQQKIVNNEDEGWKFYDKNYTCSDKSSMKAEIEKTVNDNYSKIVNQGSYIFSK